MSKRSAQDDRRAIAAYRTEYGEGPFLAADAVVVSSDDHVLLVRRASPPQKGRLAFPGGFVKPDETFLQAAWRELEEEAGLSLSGIAPAGQSLRDAPDRDPRARIVSVAFLFRLDAPAAAIHIRRGDDAVEAFWKPLDDALRPEDFFADHFEIMRAFGLLPRRGIDDGRSISSV